MSGTEHVDELFSACIRYIAAYHAALIAHDFCESDVQLAFRMVEELRDAANIVLDGGLS